MEINMPIKNAKRISICKAMFFVLILKPQNTFLMIEERLCPSVSLNFNPIQQGGNTFIMKISCV